MVVTKTRQNEEQDFYFNVLDHSSSKIKKEDILTELADSRVRKLVKMSEYDPFKEVFK